MDMKTIMYESSVNDLVMQMYADRVFLRELLFIAPMSVSLIGQLIFLHVKVKDVSLGGEYSTFKYVKNPHSLQSTIHQIFQEGYDSFETAHYAMNSIRKINFHIPERFKAAAGYLMTRDPTVIEKSVPIHLKYIIDAANQSKVLAEQTSQKFSITKMLVEEVSNAITGMATQKDPIVTFKKNMGRGQYQRRLNFRKKEKELISFEGNFSQEIREALKKTISTAGSFAEFWKWLFGKKSETFTLSDLVVMDDVSHCADENSACVTTMKVLPTNRTSARTLRSYGTHSNNDATRKKTETLRKIVTTIKALSDQNMEEMVAKQQNLQTFLLLTSILVQFSVATSSNTNQISSIT